MWQRGLYVYIQKNSERCVSVCVYLFERVCCVRLGRETDVSLFWIILDYRMGTHLQCGLKQTHATRYTMSHNIHHNIGIF